MQTFRANVTQSTVFEGIHRWGAPLEVEPGELVELPFDPHIAELEPVDGPASVPEPEPVSGWQATPVEVEEVDTEDDTPEQ